MTSTTCPYCGEPLDGLTINGLHAECDRQYNEELAALDQLIQQDERSDLERMAEAYAEDPSIASLWSLHDLQEVRMMRLCAYD